MQLNDMKCTHLFVWYMSQYLTTESLWSGPRLRGHAGYPPCVSLCPAQRGGNPPDPLCPRRGWPLARGPWARGRGCHCPASASASPWSPGLACCRPRNSRTRLSLCPARGHSHEAGCCCCCCCWKFCCCCSVDTRGERRQCRLKQKRFIDMCLDLTMSLISHHHQFYKQATNLHPAFVNCLCSELDFLVPLLYTSVNTQYSKYCSNLIFY